VSISTFGRLCCLISVTRGPEVSVRGGHSREPQSPVHSTHLAQEVEVHYRWHPLYGRRVRRQYSEQRAGGCVVHVEAAPGVIIAIAAWSLDPIACGGMEIGAPRAAITALIDLHQLLIESAFRGSSRNDSSVVKEQQHEQLAKVSSIHADAARNSVSAQHHLRFHPTGGRARRSARKRLRAWPIS
jgi:hypothetical protein